MDCRTAVKSLSGYMDKELKNSLNIKISDHLTFCTGCAAEYKKLMQIEVEFKKIEQIEVSPQFSTILLGRIRGIEVESNEMNPRRFFPTWAPISAVALIVLTIFFNVATFSFALSNQPADVRAKVIQKVTECFVDSPSLFNVKSLLNYCSKCHMELCQDCQSGKVCDMSDCGGK